MGYYKNLSIILDNSETFDEFYQNAEDELGEHLQEINSNGVIFYDDIKDKAKELWDEHNNKLPF